MQTSEGSYRLRMRAVSWSGNGRDANGECCECCPLLGCIDNCDNYFIFCKRPHGYDTSSEECPGGSYQTGDLGGDNVTFSSPIDSGVPNPLVFTGTSWPVSDHAAVPGGCHMHIQCYPHIHITIGFISALCESVRR